MEFEPYRKVLPMKYEAWDRPNVMEWEHLTKIKGEHGRHIEQLWDEIAKLKKRIKELENKSGES